MAPLNSKNAAAYCGMGPRTFGEHVKKGHVKWIDAGHGEIRHKRLYEPADLDEFKANLKRLEPPCLSTAHPTRRSTSANSSSTASGSPVRLRRKTSGRRKPSSD